MQTLNFSSQKRKHLKIILSNGEVINVTTPTRLLYKEVSGTDFDNTTIDDLYELTAELLSRNLENKTFNAAELEELFDIDDLVILINGYLDFLKEIQSEKN